jgi:hypothetical protein
LPLLAGPYGIEFSGMGRLPLRLLRMRDIALIHVLFEAFSSLALSLRMYFGGRGKSSSQNLVSKAPASDFFLHE